jgi:hypothetical protein
MHASCAEGGAIHPHVAELLPFQEQGVRERTAVREHLRIGPSGRGQFKFGRGPTGVTNGSGQAGTRHTPRRSDTTA